MYFVMLVVIVLLLLFIFSYSYFFFFLAGSDRDTVGGGGKDDRSSYENVTVQTTSIDCALYIFRVEDSKSNI